MGRVSLDRIDEFIIGADDVNMDIIASGAPNAHRYKLRADRPGLMRLWAEAASLAAPEGCERYRNAVASADLVPTARGAATPQHELYPHRLVYK